ncbi:hypothetical protein Cni_G09260 [Canna indica]|uniref:DUF868 family protein n=1 Tax=Canna indica TaxID=4628 RepID=A0AAQ3K267_9LILI|nr:hypothetical protein Cni_G09260 [Canna indica]
MVGKTKKPLLFPSTMRDFASCFSESAVKISDTSCSGTGSTSDGASSSSVRDSSSSVLSAVTCLYRARLSTLKEVLLRVTWSRTHVGPAFSVSVDDGWNSDPAMNCQLVRKNKGTRSYVSGESVVDLHWDISSARYGSSSGPQPIGSFYLVVMVNRELGLLLGDMSDEYIKKQFDGTIPTAEFSMVVRKEQVVGHSVYTTRSQLCDDGRNHEITIRCKADAWDSDLTVCIDRKRVVRVRKLGWNFRGNRTIFVDRMPVDVMWDVHDWWFGNVSGGCAMFVLRARRGPESKLWLEEEALQGVSGFSLLIQVFKGS